MNQAVDDTGAAYPVQYPCLGSDDLVNSHSNDDDPECGTIPCARGSPGDEAASPNPKPPKLSSSAVAAVAVASPNTTAWADTTLLMRLESQGRVLLRDGGRMISVSSPPRGDRPSMVSFALTPEAFRRENTRRAESPSMPFTSPYATPSGRLQRHPSEVTSLQSALSPSRGRSFSVVQEEEGSWRWWVNLLRGDDITASRESRARLQAIPVSLYAQYHENPLSVELDLRRSYFSPAAPLYLAELLASPLLSEMAVVTCLRLGQNVYTSRGLGVLLRTLAEAGRHRQVLPNLRELYLDDMDLDRDSVLGLMHLLFPIDMEATHRGSDDDVGDLERRIGGSRVQPLPEAFCLATPDDGDPATLTLGIAHAGNDTDARTASLDQEAINVVHQTPYPLFPSLTVLSLADNCSIGTAGLVAVLRALIADHYEPRRLATIDFSRCGLERVSRRFVKQYFRALPKAYREGRNPVYPDIFVFSGNEFKLGEEELFKPTVDPPVQILL